MNFQLQCKRPWHLFQWFPFIQLQYNAQILYFSKISINFTRKLFPSCVNVHIILKDIIQLLLILFKRWSYDKIWKFGCKITRFSDLVLQISGVSKFFYNRRYFLNFRRYLKNYAEGRKGSRGRKLLKSSILWTKKCTSETAKH